LLNHGDSDKATSASPVARVYDRVFVAGEAGIDRHQAAGVDIPRERFAIVGRPQLDGLTVGPRPTRDDRLVVLYAPTFEGFFDDINYSSVEVMGPAMIARLLAHPSRPRIIFKPHPFTGRVRSELRVAQAEVERLLRSAGDSHLLAADQPEIDLFDWFDEADVLVSDISSVVSDFLYTSRPYVLTNPRGLSHDRFREMFPNHRGAYLVDRDLTGLDAALEAIVGDDLAATARAEARSYLLGEHEHGPQASFDRAIDELIALARRDRERIATTFTFR
jgi:CDP-glycerol glycerophosphotransferase (TagB/SpsB family)